MIANEEMLISSLAGLAGDGLDDAELERRLTRFQGAVRRLLTDPTEAARIDALAADAERDQRELGEFTAFDAVTVYVNSEVVNVTARADETIAVVQQRLVGELARLAQERQKLAELLEDKHAAARPRRRVWGLWPAFGGSLVAALAVATLAVALHASAAAASLIGVIMAVSTAASALISLGMAWASVRHLNRQGEAYKALQLMVHGDLGELGQATVGEVRTRVTPLGRSGRQDSYEEYEDDEIYDYVNADDDHGYRRSGTAPPKWKG